MDRIAGKKTPTVGKVISDLIIIGAGGVVLLLFRFVAKPYERGFFCDDTSLQHPFKPSTVSSFLLYFIGFLLGAVLIILIETIWVHRDCPQNQAQRRDIAVHGKIRVLIRDIYLCIVPFIFGAIVEHVITDIGKYSIGRLRPHFFEGCSIDVSKINCSSGYIEEFACTNEDADIVRQVRLSFPSGHSSFSSYIAAYLIIYLQKRLTFVYDSLVCPVLQLCLFSLAWYTCLSRISDYKHHPTDVLAGAIIGVASAIVTAVCVSNLFTKHAQVSTIVSEKSKYSSFKAEGSDESPETITTVM